MNKYIILNSDIAPYNDKDYIQTFLNVTGEIRKPRDLIKVLPFIMEKTESIKKKYNISGQETKLITIQILKKIIKMSTSNKKNTNVDEIIDFLENDIGEIIEIIIMSSKGDYEFNRRQTLFQKICNSVVFSKILNTCKTGAEIAMI